MRVAIISDLHGNKDAFSAVLDDAVKNEVEHLLILGDIVGYYYYPKFILQEIKKWKHDIIKGNHEIILEQLYNREINFETINKKYGSAHEIALTQFSKEELIYLFSLPSSKKVEIDGVKFSLNHGAPWSINAYLYPSSSVELFNRCDDENIDFVLVGHSHYAFSVKTKNSIVINPGSVGQSRQKGGVASWVLFDTSNLMYQFKNTNYDIESLALEIEKRDPEIEYLTSILKRK